MYIADIKVVERNHGLVVSMFLFTTLSVTAVCLRVYARAVVVRNFGIDDAFSALAAVSLFVTQSVPGPFELTSD